MVEKNQIAVVIVNYNTPELSSELAMSLESMDLYTVIVDNASKDNSLCILNSRFAKCNMVDIVSSSVNRGYSAGNNIGINYAVKHNPHLKYIVIMNPDIELYSEDTIIKCCSCLENNGNLLGVTTMTVMNGSLSNNNPCASKLLDGFRLALGDITCLSSFLNRNYKSFRDDRDGVAYVDKIQGCFFVVNIDLFREIGYFDEHVFLYYEEDIIGHKAKERGYLLGVLINSAIKHNHESKDQDMESYSKRIFHNKCLYDSKKYYMLSVKHTSYLLWLISFTFDRLSRFPKDIAMYMRGNK